MKRTIMTLLLLGVVGVGTMKADDDHGRGNKYGHDRHGNNGAYNQGYRHGSRDNYWARNNNRRDRDDRWRDRDDRVRADGWRDRDWREARMRRERWEYRQEQMRRYRQHHRRNWYRQNYR